MYHQTSLGATGFFLWTSPVALSLQNVCVHSGVGAAGMAQRLPLERTRSANSSDRLDDGCTCVAGAAAACAWCAGRDDPSPGQPVNLASRCAASQAPGAEAAAWWVRIDTQAF
jgi:hypothetical protein